MDVRDICSARRWRPIAERALRRTRRRMD